MVSLIVCILLVIVIVLLIVKIVLMRKSIGEIASSLDNILDGDTNAVILAQDGITFETLDIKAVLEESILSFYGAMNEAGIVPELSITENSVIRQSNRAALSRIFGNIIGNALKYSDGDLSVELSDDGRVTFKNHAHNLDKLRVEKLFD